MLALGVLGSTCGLAYWERVYGPTGDDTAASVRELPDGGFLVTGTSGWLSPHTPSILVLRLTSGGDLVWARNFDDGATARGGAGVPTPDGGFLIVGQTTGGTDPDGDALVMKLDGDGNALWTHRFGGEAADSASWIEAVSAGGYVVVGSTYSFGAGSQDLALWRLDAAGDVAWSRYYGTPANEFARNVEPMDDGGFVVAGTTLPASGGNSDVYLVKSDATGEVEWSKSYGGTLPDELPFVRETLDHGLIVAAQSQSFGTNHFDDLWLQRLDATGGVLWSKTSGYSGVDYGDAVAASADGGFLVLAEGQEGSGVIDAQLRKYDADGNLLWKKIYERPTYISSVPDLEPASDGGWVIAGGRWVSGSSPIQALVVHTDPEGLVPEASTSGGR